MNLRNFNIFQEEMEEIRQGNLQQSEVQCNTIFKTKFTWSNPQNSIRAQTAVKMPAHPSLHQKAHFL